MTKAETTQIATLIQQFKDIKDDTTTIITHQQYQNGKLAEASLAIEKAREIAKSAECKASTACTEIDDYKKENDKKVNRLYLLAAFLTGAGFLSGYGLSSLIG